MISKVCPQCSAAFQSRTTKKKKFCSRKCMAQSKSIYVDLVCASCQVQFKRKPNGLRNSKSGLYFCSVDCKNDAMRSRTFPAIIPTHYDTSSRNASDTPERDAVGSRSEIICYGCKVMFLALDRRIKGLKTNKIYCSSLCRASSVVTADTRRERQRIYFNKMYKSSP